MALVKLNSSSKKELCDLSNSEDVRTTGIVPNIFGNYSPFPQVYCKRITVQNSNGSEPPVTRIEEAVFSCQSDQSVRNPYNQFRGEQFDHSFQPDNFMNQSHRRKKSSHPKKDSHPKSPSKKNGHTRSKHTKQNKAFFIKITAAVILGCSLFGWWFSKYHWCQAKPLDFQGLESSLKMSVIGQEDTLNYLLLNFYKTSYLNSQPPVFLFSGSTGVGKSFLVDQILDNFPGSGHKEILFYPTPAPDVVVAKLASCEHNLLVLDGLYFKDSFDISSWASRVQNEAAAHSKSLWIILVFTTEHWTSDTTATSNAEFFQEISKISNRIEEVFISQSVATELIIFKPMEVHDVKECVRRELENLSLLADETQLDEIVHQLTKTPTLRQKGCKHVKKYFLHSSNTIGLAEAVN